jgi:hypothetical protein
MSLRAPKEQRGQGGLALRPSAAGPNGRRAKAQTAGPGPAGPRGGGLG